ncbi:hypothetical protein ACP70R_033640 [Stipagrostis hirtigluma subsp. patula]
MAPPRSSALVRSTCFLNVTMSPRPARRYGSRGLARTAAGAEKQSDVMRRRSGAMAAAARVQGREEESGGAGRGEASGWMDRRCLGRWRGLMEGRGFGKDHFGERPREMYGREGQKYGQDLTPIASDDTLDKTRFHVIGAILFTAQQGALHPTAVVKTRMQVAEGGLAHMSGFTVFRRILRADGIAGVFRGFGTSAVGALPGRVLALTSLEVSKEMTLKYSERFDMSEASRIAVANGVAGLMSSVCSCSYFVPLDVICQRLMVQGLPGMATYRGPFDVINKVVRTEGIRGLYRGFGITILSQSPASALWWSAYGGAQHAIWRSLGYRNDSQTKPSQSELVAVQATAGTIAGACSSIITTPIDTIKTRLQGKCLGLATAVVYIKMTFQGWHCNV